MGRKFDLTFFEQHGAEWVETIRAAHRERLDREPTSAEITFYLSRIMSNAWESPAIQRNIEALDEFTNRQQPPEPPAPPISPIPPAPPTPPPVIEKVEAVGSRAVSAGLQVGLTRFYWLREWKFNRDRVLRELDQDAAAGFTYARVLAQVGSHDPQDPWYGLMTDPNWPDHSELVRGLTEAAMARGMRILWTFLGKAMPKQADRRVFVARMADVLKAVPAGVLTQEIMNEPACGSGLTGGSITASEILELRDIAAANGLLSATGAVWTEPDWVKETPYPDATGMTPEGWAKTQRGVGISHNDRDMSRGEGQDRPWRQGWDIGLEGMRWIENEGVGPGSSVSSENRPEVLRSHRLVNFICRAFASCLHGSFGVRGDKVFTPEEIPGYVEAPKAVRFLPADLPNGSQQNANTNYPNRPFQLEDTYLRSAQGNRAGMVRCYSCAAPDGRIFSVPFGILTESELIAQFNMKIRQFDQKLGEQVGEMALGAGERLRVTTGVDRLFEVTRL